MASIENSTDSQTSATKENTPPQENSVDLGATTNNTLTKTRRNFPRRTKLLLLVGITFFVALLFMAVLLLSNNDTKTSTTSSSNAQKLPTSDSTTTPEKVTADETTLTGNTFFEIPKKIENLQLIASGEDAVPYESYYHVGNTKSNKRIIVYYYDTQSIEGTWAYLFLENSTTEYIVNEQLNSLSADDKKNLSTKVTYDVNKKISELNYPKETTVAGQVLKTAMNAPFFDPEGSMSEINKTKKGTTFEVSTPKKVGEFGSYTLYKRTYSTSSTYDALELHAISAGMFRVIYNLSGELYSSENLPITWTKGDSDTVKAYTDGGGGCGLSGYVVGNINKAHLIETGKTKEGKLVYYLQSTAPLAIEMYDDYKTAADSFDTVPQGLTIDQLTAKHGYFLAENNYGEYVLFLRSDIFVRGGCGKPVVYLYPTTPTNVSVKVAADVVISEPTYEKDGWQNVFAQPNGILTYRGNTFDSLYWEGYGHGPYPEITEGSVVTRANAPQVMRSQLAEQGFTTKEITDFMHFWESKLPNTPYIRLTWLGTRAMDRLAPLEVIPTPQTVIRTFLDFEGLQQPMELKQQTFKAQERTGFTVTEWGGLLRNGL